jgi:outer membrane protein TolC
VQKRISLCVVIICLAALKATAEEYDLSAYLRLVEQNNTDIALAYKDMRLSREQVNQTRAPLLPGIGAEGSYARNLRDMPRSTAYDNELPSA